MTPKELWRAVGEALMLQRTRRGWKNPIDVQRAGGPTYATVIRIESGKVKTVESLRKHAEALDLSIVDVLRSVLLPKDIALSPEALLILGKLESTTVGGRAALLAMARELPDEKQQAQDQSLPAALASVPRKPR